MHKLHKNQAGFSAVEVMLVLIIVGMIGFAGWYVWHAKQITNKTYTPPRNASVKSTTKAKPISSKTYSNEEYGFSFQYPATWTLKEDLGDAGRGHNEGTIDVVSPYGTDVQFGPNLGGKGGDCWDDMANARTTRTCFTTNILSVQKLLSSDNDNPIYFYQVSITEPTRDGGKTTYAINIGGGKYAYTSAGSRLGMGGFGYDTVENTKVGAVSVYVKGKDDSKNDSQEFFNTREVNEATLVLKSFKLLN